MFLFNFMYNQNKTKYIQLTFNNESNLDDSDAAVRYNFSWKEGPTKAKCIGSMRAPLLVPINPWRRSVSSPCVCFSFLLARSHIPTSLWLPRPLKPDAVITRRASNCTRTSAYLWAAPHEGASSCLWQWELVLDWPGGAPSWVTHFSHPVLPSPIPIGHLPSADFDK